MPQTSYIPGNHQENLKFTNSSDIITRDRRLNHDGEALYRYIQVQSSKSPRCILHCQGTRQEERSSSNDETYTAEISDFRFGINLTNKIVLGPVHWRHADLSPVYRGGTIRQVITPKGKRRATEDEIKQFKRTKVLREAQGLPPWQGSYSLVSEQSEQMLRQCISEYCASPRRLKEFVYEKVVYGWDIMQMEEAVRGAIRDTGYQGDIFVTVQLNCSKIRIISDGIFSQCLAYRDWKTILICTLLCPFMWLYERLSSRRAGRWEVCGGAYAFKHFELAGIGETGFSVCNMPRISVEDRPALVPRITIRDGGPAKLFGLREGEWFKQWEAVIKRSVALGLKSTDILNSPSDGPLDPSRAFIGFVR